MTLAMMALEAQEAVAAQAVVAVEEEAVVMTETMMTSCSAQLRSALHVLVRGHKSC